MRDTNDTITVGDIKKLIRREMNLDEGADNLNESFVAQPKQFDLNTEKLSDLTRNIHKKLYEGYIETFNRTSSELDTVDRKMAAANSSRFRSLKRDETYNLNAIYLHELYFANIADPESTLYSDTLACMRLERDFGGIDAWQRDFVACAMSAREGWAVCCLNTFLKRYVNVVIDGHDGGVPVGCMPVIVLDVWTHSYQDTQYQNNRKKYVLDMMVELNWRVIEERFEKAERMMEALK